jgi:hypothetical protein
MSISAGSGHPQVREITLNPGNVVAGATSAKTFTVTGLTTDMVPIVTAPNLEAGVYLVGPAWVSATNTLKLIFWNTTGADVDPASQVFKLIVL